MGLIVNFVLILVVGYSEQNILSDKILNVDIPTYLKHKIQTTLQNGKDLTPQCAKQLDELGEQFNQTWALKMFDANGKLPAGFLEGNIDMGSFDECISVESPSGLTVGQHCMADIRLILKKGGQHAVLRHNIGDIDIMKAAPRMVQSSTYLLKHGFCVPHGCTANDSNTIFTGLNAKFSETGCQTRDSYSELDAAAISFICFLGTVLGIMLMSTLYDAYSYYTQNDSPILILTTFSVLTNGKKLLRTSKNPDFISCLNGIRTMSIVWVIVGHTFVMRVTYPLRNLLFIFEWLDDTRNMFIIGATVSVDTFLLLSGLTLTYSYLVYMSKEKKFNLLLFYFHRYVRLTPALAVMLFFNVSILKYMGSGPYWPTTAINSEVPCKNSWWRALLYIQNYWPQTDMCMGHTWYLSVDTQLYLISPIILIPLHIWPNLTVIGTGILAILSIIGCFLTGWFYELNGSMLGNTKQQAALDYFEKYYVATYTRVSVWFIGVLYGYLLFKIKNRKSKLSIRRDIVLISWIITLTVLCTCVYVGHDLKDQGNGETAKEFNKFENSIYLALMRPSWGLAAGWMIIMCFTGYGGPINWFLSLPGFEVLAKLSYCMYLVHSNVMLFQAGQTRTPAVFNNFNMMFTFWGDFGFTVIISVLLYLGIEYPFALLEQHLLGRAKGGTNKKEQQISKNVLDLKQP